MKSNYSYWLTSIEQQRAPSKASFGVRGLNADQSKRDHPAVFARLVWCDRGCFDFANGIFTAPTAGSYKLTVAVGPSQADRSVHVYIMVDGVYAAYARASPTAAGKVDLYCELNQGHRAWLKMCSAIADYHPDELIFVGSLVKRRQYGIEQHVETQFNVGPVF